MGPPRFELGSPAFRCFDHIPVPVEEIFEGLPVRDQVHLVIFFNSWEDGPSYPTAPIINFVTTPLHGL